MTRLKSRYLFLLLLGITLAGGSSPLFSFRKFNSNPADLLALGGYDAVAYVESGRAVKGAPIFFHQWEGVYWRFANKANLQKFRANPKKFAPDLGGYCALSMADEKSNPCDPRVFAVYNGQLYVFGNEAVKQRWLKDPERFIREGRLAYTRMADADSES
jgi:YHS domain-containing protein